MIAAPVSAACRCLLPDGRVLTVSATRRPRANRAEVKCTLTGQAAFSERVAEVVRLARHTEARHDSRDQVLISIDPLPEPHQRDWELAAVLADRIVRGHYQPLCANIYAQGCSDQWQLGQINPQSAQNRQQLERMVQQHQGGAAQSCMMVVAEVADLADLAGAIGVAAVPDASLTARPAIPATESTQPIASGQIEWLNLTHLGGLNGHPNPAGLVSASRTWFPLHSGGLHDSLNWVEVSVHPLHAAGQSAGQADPLRTEEDTITVLGLPLTQQLAVRQVLAAARQFDPKGEGRWRTVVRFGQREFQGDSYQLALVMADRIARGRDFAARGRLIATGCSPAWHSGQVQTVEGCAAKCALIATHITSGDRVLLPKAWQADLPPALLAAVKQQGASLACIERIGFF